MNKLKTSSRLESLLGLSLPSDYKAFIDKVGYLYLDHIGIEVYGFAPNFDIEKIPCVVAATRQNREMYKLSDSEIVISHTGFEELIVLLDTVTGFVSELGFNGVRDKTADSFSSWLLKMQSKNETLKSK